MTAPMPNKIDERFLEDLYRASPLHDIGKVGISDAILLKPARLTPDEFETMKQHTIIGANILDNVAIAAPRTSVFSAWQPAVARFHHERFDGCGYPVGLRGTEIPLPARIVALADAYDAITSMRPYKAAQSATVARDIIQRDSGSHFDPVDRGGVPAALRCLGERSEADSRPAPVVIGANSLLRADGSRRCIVMQPESSACAERGKVYYFVFGVEHEPASRNRGNHSQQKCCLRSGLFAPGRGSHVGGAGRFVRRGIARPNQDTRNPSRKPRLDPVGPNCPPA